MEPVYPVSPLQVLGAIQVSPFGQDLDPQHGAETDDSYQLIVFTAAVWWRANSVPNQTTKNNILLFWLYTQQKELPASIFQQLQY